MPLAGPTYHTSIQYMDCVKIFSLSLDLSTMYLLVLVDAELPLFVVVIPSQNTISSLLGSS